MGTEVIVKLQNTVLTKTFAPGEQLASKVYSTISSFQSQAGAGALTVSSVLYTENKLPVEDWEERRVGLKPLTVVVEAQQTFQEQMASMLQRLQQLEGKVSIVSKPRVANLAAQILLLACGVEDFHETTTHHFSALGVQHPRVKAVSGFLGVQPRVFVTQANALVTRRNNIHIHFASREALDKEVAEVVGLINSDLRQELQWECKIVENYGTIKGSIPQ
jgi:hypothetical protein